MQANSVSTAVARCHKTTPTRIPEEPVANRRRTRKPARLRLRAAIKRYTMEGDNAYVPAGAGDRDAPRSLGVHGQRRRCSLSLAAAALLALVLAACEDTAPTVSGVPSVAGTYTGDQTISIPELGLTGTGQMTMTVVQDGETLTITGSQTWDGVTTGLTALTGTVSKTGVFTAEESGVVDAEAALSNTICGRLRPISASLTFVQRRIEYEVTVQSTLCGLISLYASLTR